MKETPPPPRIAEYEISEGDFLGEGTYGWVWRARYKGELGKRAVKVIKRGAVVEQRWRKEYLALEALGDHSGIVKLYDVGRTEDGLPFYAMHLHADAEGGGAKKWRGRDLARFLDSNKTIPPETRRKWVFEILDTLAFLHSRDPQVIHCDLKPSNILLTAHEEPRTLLSDFGQALESGSAGTAAGTLFYAAPEQLRDATAPSTQWDVYSFGVVAFEILTGHRPRNADAEALEKASPTEENPGQRKGDDLARFLEGQTVSWPEDCPADGGERKVIEKCLALDPTKRFRDMVEVRAAFRAWETEKALAKERRRRTIFGWLAGAAAVAALVALVLFLIAQNASDKWQDAEGKARNLAVRNEDLAKQQQRIAEKERQARQQAESLNDSLRTALTRNSLWLARNALRDGQPSIMAAILCDALQKDPTNETLKVILFGLLNTVDFPTPADDPASLSMPSSQAVSQPGFSRKGTQPDLSSKPETTLADLDAKDLSSLESAGAPIPKAGADRKMLERIHVLREGTALVWLSGDGLLGYWDRTGRRFSMFSPYIIEESEILSADYDPEFGLAVVASDTTGPNAICFCPSKRFPPEGTQKIGNEFIDLLPRKETFTVPMTNATRIDLPPKQHLLHLFGDFADERDTSKQHLLIYQLVDDTLLPTVDLPWDLAKALDFSFLFRSGKWRDISVNGALLDAVLAVTGWKLAEDGRLEPVAKNFLPLMHAMKDVPETDVPEHKPRRELIKWLLSPKTTRGKMPLD